METCFQCKNASANPFRIIGIMRLDTSANPSAIIQIEPSGKWMAVGICERCHQQPKLKAHFNFRSNMEMALRNAGSDDLGK